MVVEARGKLTCIVAVLADYLLEEIVGKNSCFRKYIHAHLDFEIDILVVENVAQVVFLDNLIP